MIHDMSVESETASKSGSHGWFSYTSFAITNPQPFNTLRVYFLGHAAEMTAATIVEIVCSRTVLRYPGRKNDKVA